MAVSPRNPPPADHPSDHRVSATLRNAFGERTLRHVLLETQQLDWQEVVVLGLQIGEQIEQHHARGRCPHGAISPENIFVNEDGSGYRIGPPSAEVSTSYSAPEVLHGGPEPPDASSDVYSLGVVLYEALAGNHCLPFHVQQRVTGSGGIPEWTFTPARDNRAALAHVPAPLRRAIEQATRLTPRNRFTSMGRFVEALQAASSGEVEKSRKLRAPASENRGSRRKVAVGLGLVSVIFLAAVTWLFLPYFVQSPAEEEMRAARAEALAASAPVLASETWEKGEQHDPRSDFSARSRLYRLAREEARTVLVERVGQAEKEAIAFNATAEPLFARAQEARQRAEQLWALSRFGEAVQRFQDAEEFFLAARSSRRQRIASRLEEQLDSEENTIRRHLSDATGQGLTQKIEAIRAVLRRETATLSELNEAEQQLADLRQQIASALQEAGEKQAAKRAAEEALATSDRERLALQPLRKAFPSIAAAAERGEAFLASAREAIEYDPARAVALADAARSRFQAARASAEQEVVNDRRTATKARQQAEQTGANEIATEQFEEGQTAFQRAEAALRTGDLTAARAAFRDASAAFGRAREETEKELERREEAARRATAAQRRAEVRPTPPPQPTLPTSAHVVAVPPPGPARSPMPVAPRPQQPAKDLGPISPSLAQAIQSWLANHCRTLDRSLAASQARRARCDQLVVLDRQDVRKVLISFQYASGQAGPDGIRWEHPDTRTVTLDCSGSTCRCLRGEGC